LTCIVEQQQPGSENWYMAYMNYLIYVICYAEYLTKQEQFVTVWSGTCCAIIFTSVGIYLQEVNIKPIEG